MLPQPEDWPTLASHLLNDFPDATITDVVRELRATRDAVSDKGLDAGEQLEVGEVIVRHHLMIITGRLSDAARLDPEPRSRAE